MRYALDNSKEISLFGSVGGRSSINFNNDDLYSFKSSFGVKSFLLLFFPFLKRLTKNLLEFLISLLLYNK